jgi:hypothetical protein
MANKYELTGDVDNNGKITTFDVLLICNHIVGLITLNADQQLRADVNADGEVKETDARAVLRHLSGENLITQMVIVLD